MFLFLQQYILFILGLFHTCQSIGEHDVISLEKILCVKSIALKIKAVPISIAENSSMKERFFRKGWKELLCRRYWIEGVSREAAWLVRTLVQGETLEKLIQTGVRYDADRVIDCVLRQLVKLETIGYSHFDVNIPNVVLDFSGKVSLIDFGSILPTSKEKKNSFLVFLSFVLFVRDVMTMNRSESSRSILLAFFQIPGQHRKWLIQNHARFEE